MKRERDQGDGRQMFWQLLEVMRDDRRKLEELFDCSLSRVRTVLHTFDHVRDACGYHVLEEVPEQLFRDVLRALWLLHPDFTLRDFGEAAGYKRTYMSNLISASASSRARCRIQPHQYEKLLAIFTRPSDFIDPSGPYGKWRT